VGTDDIWAASLATVLVVLCSWLVRGFFAEATTDHHQTGVRSDADAWRRGRTHACQPSARGSKTLRHSTLPCRDPECRTPVLTLRCFVPVCPCRCAARGSYAGSPVRPSRAGVFLDLRRGTGSFVTAEWHSGCRVPAADHLANIADGSGAILRSRALRSGAPSCVV
jgi:hypothetical protein